MRIPDSVGQLQDDAIAEVIHLPQPEIIHNVIAIHKRLQGDQRRERTIMGKDDLIISWTVDVRKSLKATNNNNLVCKLFLINEYY